MRAAVRVVGAALLAVPCFLAAQARTTPALDKLATEFAAAYNAHDAARIAGLGSGRWVDAPQGALRRRTMRC